VVSYSFPRLVTTVAGAAVEVDLVGVLLTALALAVVFAFFGGMLAMYRAGVWCIVEGEDVASRNEGARLESTRELQALRKGSMLGQWPVHMT
jgi:hypothetical protein